MSGNRSERRSLSDLLAAAARQRADGQRRGFPGSITGRGTPLLRRRRRRTGQRRSAVRGPWPRGWRRPAKPSRNVGAQRRHAAPDKDASTAPTDEPAEQHGVNGVAHEAPAAAEPAAPESATPEPAAPDEEAPVRPRPGSAAPDGPPRGALCQARREAAREQREAIAPPVAPAAATSRASRAPKPAEPAVVATSPQTPGATRVARSRLRRQTSQPRQQHHPSLQLPGPPRSPPRPSPRAQAGRAEARNAEDCCAEAETTGGTTASRCDAGSAPNPTTRTAEDRRAEAEAASASDATTRAITTCAGTATTGSHAGAGRRPDGTTTARDRFSWSLR